MDLVLDERGERLVVAHPMEYKRKSEYYSPCANVPFDDMVRALRNEYGDDFFVSMEPKAAWGGTREELEDEALADLPSSVLEKLLGGIESHHLDGKCAAIVEIDGETAHAEGEVDREREFLASIRRHCQLFRGVRLSDGAPTGMGEYDMLMPTIEFHPSHAHNSEGAGKAFPQGLSQRSVFWVVDTAADLELAASLRPHGIVSNSPRNIVRIVEGKEWCDED